MLLWIRISHVGNIWSTPNYKSRFMYCLCGTVCSVGCRTLGQRQCHRFTYGPLLPRYIRRRLGLVVRYSYSGSYRFCYSSRGTPGGATPSLLLLHGFSANKDMWLTLIPVNHTNRPRFCSFKTWFLKYFKKKRKKKRTGLVFFLFFFNKPWLLI